MTIHEVLTREQYLEGALTPPAVADTFSLNPDSNSLTLTIAPSRSTDIEDAFDLVANLDPGLHQVSIAIGDDIVDRTHILVQPDPTERQEPLGVSVALLVETQPVLQPSGERVIALEDRQRLDTLATAFELIPDAPFTIQLQPDIIEALALSGETEDQVLLGRLRAALTWSLGAISTGSRHRRRSVRQRGDWSPRRSPRNQRRRHPRCRSWRESEQNRRPARRHLLGSWNRPTPRPGRGSHRHRRIAAGISRPRSFPRNPHRTLPNERSRESAPSTRPKPTSDWRQRLSIGSDVTPYSKNSDFSPWTPQTDHVA